MGNSSTRRELLKASLGSVIAVSVPIAADQGPEKLKGLRADFTDDFSIDGPMDANKWVSLRSSLLRCEKGNLVLEMTGGPPGPGAMCFGAFATRERHFNPGLKGTNLFELDIADYSREGEYITKYHGYDISSRVGDTAYAEDQLVGLYLGGIAISIGSFQGDVSLNPGDPRPHRSLVGWEKITHRVVQINFDWWQKGPLLLLHRGKMGGDLKTFTMWDQIPAEKIADFDYMGKGGWIADAAVALSQKRLKPGSLRPYGHRFGLFLTDDANTVGWTLDGKIQDSVNIAGYFSSSPEVVKDGAYAAVGPVGTYERSIWEFASAKTYISK